MYRYKNERQTDRQTDIQKNRDTVMKMIERTIVACSGEIIFIFESCVTTLDLGTGRFYWRNQNCEKEKEKGKKKNCDCLIWQGTQKMQFAYKNIDTE